MSAKNSPFLHTHSLFLRSTFWPTCIRTSREEWRWQQERKKKKYVLIVRTEFLFESYLTSEINFPLFHARKILYRIAQVLAARFIHDPFAVFVVVFAVVVVRVQWGSCWGTKFCSRSLSVGYRRCTGWHICAARDDASQIHIDDVTKFRNVLIVGVDNVLEIPSSTQKKDSNLLRQDMSGDRLNGTSFGGRFASRAKAHMSSRNKLIRMQFEKIVRYINANNCDTLCE